jgi:hypothetical protein
MHPLQLEFRLVPREGGSEVDHQKMTRRVGDPNDVFKRRHGHNIKERSGVIIFVIINDDKGSSATTAIDTVIHTGQH